MAMPGCAIASVKSPQSFHVAISIRPLTRRGFAPVHIEATPAPHSNSASQAGSSPSNIGNRAGNSANPRLDVALESPGSLADGLSRRLLRALRGLLCLLLRPARRLLHLLARLLRLLLCLLCRLLCLCSCLLRLLFGLLGGLLAFGSGLLSLLLCLLCGLLCLVCGLLRLLLHLLSLLLRLLHRLRRGLLGLLQLLLSLVQRLLRGSLPLRRGLAYGLLGLLHGTLRLLHCLLLLLRYLIHGLLSLLSRLLRGLLRLPGGLLGLLSRLLRALCSGTSRIGNSRQGGGRIKRCEGWNGWKRRSDWRRSPTAAGPTRTGRAASSASGTAVVNLVGSARRLRTADRPCRAGARSSAAIDQDHGSRNCHSGRPDGNEITRCNQAEFHPGLNHHVHSALDIHGFAGIKGVG